MIISKADHQRIAEAVRAAEANTNGEVFCIVTQEVSQYREIPLAWAAAAALIVPPLLLVFGLQPWTYLNPLMDMTRAGDWSTGGARTAVAETLAAYAAGQAILFALVAVIVSIPEVRRRLTPRFLKRHRVRKFAYGHFASTGLSADAARTGVLIFASLGDRQVEIVADKAIHDAVGDKVWDAAVGALVGGMQRGRPGQGFVDAIGICGTALAEHFPSSGERDNRFSDELVEV